MKKEGLFILAFLIAIFLASAVSAETTSPSTNNSVRIEKLTNESLYAKSLLENAQKDINEMKSKQIPIMQVTEIYDNANQLYEEKLVLEQSNRKVDYSTVRTLAGNISRIKSTAIEAQDKLSIFNQEYQNSLKEFNLSKMDEEYNNIQKSFSEERFEDTINLIDLSYTKLNNIKASQTATRVFLENTSKTLKNFLINNWKKLISLKFYESLYFYIIVIIILTIIFWKTITRLKIRARIYNLALQRDTLLNQIKKLQGEYFKTKNISETEFYSKIDRFKEMIRDIDRQIPLLKEGLIKANEKSKNLKSSSSKAKERK